MADDVRIDLWMPVYIGDYLADTQNLAAQEHGCYFLLLMAYWRTGPLPNDPRQLAAICKMDASSNAPSNAWAYAWSVLKPFFYVGEDGRLHQKRIDEEIERATVNRSKKKSKAEKAAKARWEGHASSNASSIPQSNAPAMHEQCPSPSPSQVVVDTKNVSTTKPKKKRSKFTFEKFSDGTSEVVNHFAKIWPGKRRDGSDVNFSQSMFADRVSALLKEGLTVSQLIACGDEYLAEKPDWPACPQYFFGPGNGKSANFSSYMKMLIYQQSKAEAAHV